MSDLKTRVYDDVKTAMKAGEKERLAMLRMLTAELKQREVVESTALTDAVVQRSEEHTSELQSLMRTSYAVFCLKQQHTSIISTQSTTQPICPNTPFAST